MYFLAEQSKHFSRNYLTFLVGNVVELYQQKSSKNDFIQFNDYLVSYVCRSRKLTTNRIKSITEVILDEIKKDINKVVSKSLSQFFDENIWILTLTQTFMRIIGGTEVKIER